MKNLEIGPCLAELNVCFNEVGKQANLVGRCQDNCGSAVSAARFPHKVIRPVLAGALINTGAGHEAIKQLLQEDPLIKGQLVPLEGTLNLKTINHQ